MKLTHQFMRFAAVGACGTAAHYLVLFWLVEGEGVAPTLATSAGFVVGAVVNYVLNRIITFRSTANHGVAVAKFLLIALLGACANAAIMWLLSEQLGWHYFVAQVVATAAVLCWNFIGNRYWTFRDALSSKA